MTRILRLATRIANKASLPRFLGARFVGRCLPAVLVLATSVGALTVGKTCRAADSVDSTEIPKVDETSGALWDFGGSDDRNFDDWPDGWQKARGVGYPAYVTVKIEAREPEIEDLYKKLDVRFVRAWRTMRELFPSLSATAPSLPADIVDSIIDRYLLVTLNGGQAKVQTSRVAVSRLYQYRFTCEIMTRRLRHDTAMAELVFLDDDGNEIESHPTRRVGGTTPWTKVEVDRLQPPIGATSVTVRLHVQRAEDGLEDIKGFVGFDNLHIQQYPQLQVATDEPLGVYSLDQPVDAIARVMGLPMGASKVRFRLYSSDDDEIATRLVSVQKSESRPGRGPSRDNNKSELRWRLPRLPQGYYRVAAELEGNQTDTLSTDATFAIIDRLIDGPPHGSFGWTLKDGNQGIAGKDLAPWLARLGVAWLKYPCWLAPEDNVAAEEVAMIFNKLQDSGIQTVGLLDVPPDDQIRLYNLRGRKDLVAAQLFRDLEVWKPLLEPVMTRLTLKVRTWQIGADRDHSFLGRPRLRDSIKRISEGLQGFGQPIDVAISWPWLERELGRGESSWQAICRSSDPPLGADELHAFLSLKERGTRGDDPRTWMLLDPVSRSQYDRDARIRDLVLRMATVRSHRVQAAFVSDPRDPEHGLLRGDGRPGELLLPWRTTARLIGNLRHVGSLQLRSKSANAVFAGNDRAVMMVWSAEPTEEKIFLGNNVRSIDVWGRVTQLPLEMENGQQVQRVQIGPIPRFIVGADPTLLALRMSVALDRTRLDCLLGQVQKMAVSFTNPTRDGLVGDLRVIQPEAWKIESPRRSWETLPGRSNSSAFNVILGNSAKIGVYEVPIQFEIQTVPIKRITVHRWVTVGPEGVEIKVDTRLARGGDLIVQIEITNRTDRTQSYDCMLFPEKDRQYQRRFITVEPGETIRRPIFWRNGKELVGRTMLLRAEEQDGRRVVNYEIQVRP